MIRLIDADSLKYRLEDEMIYNDASTVSIRHALNEIDDTPAHNLVQCWECKHCQKQSKEFYWCAYHGMRTTDRDYCSRGVESPDARERSMQELRDFIGAAISKGATT